MKTLMTREEVVCFLLEEGKACNFARAAINFIAKEWPDHPKGLLYGFVDGHDDLVPVVYSEIEILTAYRAVESIMTFDGQKIYIDGIPLFNKGGWPL